MNQAQIDFVLSLDPDRLDGTIQSFLMSYPKLSEVSFEQFAKALLKRMYMEKQFLVQDNIKAWRKVDELQKRC
jgi:hypothetical protein